VKERARGPLSPRQVWWGSDFTRRRGDQKRWVFICLSVLLFVCPSRIWTSEFVRPISSSSRWSTKTILMHSLRLKVPILYNGRPYPPEVPLPTEDLDLPCITWCFRPMRAHNPNGTSIGSADFSQMTAECLYSLQWFACFPLKIASSHVGIWTSCNTWLIGPIRVRNAHGNLVVSAVFCRAQ